jgi:predicted SAM-dependent methyltransferase
VNAVPLRLHLGCGENYLPGFVNVELPGDTPVQVETQADLYADLRELDYETCSVDEIRLHHVFEHFTRPTALGLLVRWYEWLADGGRLTIETPDFERMLRAFRRSTDGVEQSLALRHIFGSHEAAWAVHCDGWYRARFQRTLLALGYGELEFTETTWRGTANITVDARKRSPFAPVDSRIVAAEGLLRESLVDESPSELRLLAAWTAEFRAIAAG